MLTLQKLSFLLDSAKKSNFDYKFTSFVTNVNMKKCVILLRHFIASLCFLFLLTGGTGESNNLFFSK